MDALKDVSFSSWLCAELNLSQVNLYFLSCVENGHENFPQWCTLVIYKDKVGEQN